MLQLPSTENAMVFHTGKEIPQGLVNKAPNQLLARFSGEFTESDLESSFLNDTWADYKKSPRNAMLIGALILIAFAGVDLLSVPGKLELLLLFPLRGITAIFLVGSSIYVHRARDYFEGFQPLTLVNQLVVASALILVGVIKQLSFIHNAFHVFMVTLVFYQFVHNRFIYTLVACAFSSAAYLAVSFGMYQLRVLDLVRFVLYLTLANGLGIPMLRYLNRSRRKEYIRYLKEQHLSRELRDMVDQLRKAYQEVRTLQGLIPICSHCKKIRDDNGYWNQIECYIQDHSEAKFSHGICPECAKKLYPNLTYVEGT
jgi:hypothetical protein